MNKHDLKILKRTWLEEKGTNNQTSTNNNLTSGQHKKALREKVHLKALETQHWQWTNGSIRLGKKGNKRTLYTESLRIEI